VDVVHLRPYPKRFGPDTPDTERASDRCVHDVRQAHGDASMKKGCVEHILPTSASVDFDQVLIGIHP